MKHNIMPIAFLASAMLFLSSCTHKEVGDGVMHADFNNDSLTDTVYSEYERAHTNIYLELQHQENNSEYSPQLVASLPQAKTLLETEIRDYNKDNRPDIGVIWYNTHNGAGVFNNRTIYYNHGSTDQGIDFSTEKKR